MCLVFLIERWFWELNMLIGSLVELHVGLHSCLCFSHLEKLVLNAGSTSPRYLAVCRASSTFSNCNPDSFLIPGGSIKNGSASSIASQHLVDRSSFYSWFCWDVHRHLLDTSVVDDHFLDTCICRDLLLALFKLPVQFGTQFIRYLSRYFSVFSPKTFSSHSKLCSSRILQAFLRISSLGKLPILSHSCISCFET